MSEQLLGASNPPEEDLETYKTLVGPKEWRNLALQLINSKKCDVRIRMKLCRQLECFDTLIDIIKHPVPSWYSYTDSLRSFYDVYITPNDSFITARDKNFVPNTMINLIGKELSDVRSRKTYKSCAHILKSLCTGGQRETLVRNFAEDLMKKYRIRKAMVEEFKTAGF